MTKKVRVLKVVYAANKNGKIAKEIIRSIQRRSQVNTLTKWMYVADLEGLLVQMLSNKDFELRKSQNVSIPSLPHMAGTMLGSANNWPWEHRTKTFILANKTCL